MNMRIALAVVGLMAAAANGYAAKASPLQGYGDGGFSPRFVQKVSCDMRGDDKQARCMEACDEIWIKATQAYNGDIQKAKVDKKTCESACGC